MLSTNDKIRIRIRLIAIVLVPVVIALAVRLYFVQVVNHSLYLEKARARYTTTKITTGKRGEIFDQFGNLLVSNAPCVRIIADPSHLKTEAKRVRLSSLLALLLPEKSYQEYYDRLSPVRVKLGKDNHPVLDAKGKPVLDPRHYTVIARAASLDATEKLRAVTAKNDLPGLFYQNVYQRTYPKGSLLSNVLGFTNMVGDDDVAQTGLEKYFDSQMTARMGHETYERARAGRPLLYGAHITKQARDGRNIYLTISEPIQSILEEELDKSFAEWRPKTLYAAIVDPKTGNVLAMAQRPTFNPNDRATYTAEAGRNRIAEDSYEPGSVAKPFTVGKALDWGIVTPDTKVDCEHGLWHYLGKPLRDSHHNEILTVTQVIQKSSNIGTAKIALMLGQERVLRALRLFGLGTKTNLPFRTETSGYLPGLSRWDGLSITRFPIGYGIRVTPLQLLRAYCALANGGRMPQLRLVDRVEDPATGRVERIPAVEPVQLFDHPEADKTLVDMMIKVTEEGGTAFRASVPGYNVAGKTGTSRKYIPGHGYSAGQYFATFVGFVPARNPAFVMLVTMDDPQGGYYASTVAAPTFRHVAERVLRHLNIPPDPALLPENKRKAEKP